MRSYLKIWKIALSLIDSRIGKDKLQYILRSVIECNHEFMTLNKIYERFAISAENHWIMPKVIGWVDKQPDMMKALKYFDISKIAHWKEHDYFLALTNTARGKKADLSRKRNLWEIYARSLFDIKQYLLQFRTEDGSEKKFRSLMLGKSLSKEAAWSNAEIISKSIYGMGPALVCDALKEIGVTQYSKPDVHLRDIFSWLEGKRNLTDQEIFYATWEFAESVCMQPSQIDKILWLIGSGDFYMIDMQMPGMKAEFYALLKSDQLVTGRR